MTDIRIKPVINKNRDTLNPSKNKVPTNCIWIPFALIASCFISYMIVKNTSGSGSSPDQIIYNGMSEFISYGILFLLVIIMIVGVISMLKNGIAEYDERQEWKRTCQSVEAVIINRSAYPGGSYHDEYGIPYSVRASYSLTLKLTDQPAVAAVISEAVYKKLEDRSSVRIYYKPDSPLTFLLEPEI